jgi:stage III sporulation protein AA
MASVFADGCAHSLLLVGEPASGKTSLLRDLARQLADTVKGKGLRVSVVDERGELGDMDTLHHCDVIAGCPKPTGILQAVRCLSPDVIFLDELGSNDEILAIRQGLQCGVSVVASIHAANMAALKQRPIVRDLLQEKVFDYIAMLLGRQSPCKVKQLYTGGV